MAVFERINDHTWALDDQGVRIFLITGEKKALVIDSGVTGLDIHEKVRPVTNLPIMLINTHADPDHTAGNGQFPEFMMHASEEVVYHKIFHREGRIIPVFEKDKIDLGGRILEVIHVPGHTPGSITLMDKEERCLIGGDPIQLGGEIYMFGLHRDMEAYVHGLEHLMEREGEFDCVLSSHMQLRVPKEVIPELIAGAKDILSGKVKGEDREIHAQKIVSYDIGIDRFLCDQVRDGE